MLDWLDEMLLELPLEDLPPDLIRNTQAKVERYRRKKERIRMALHILNGTMALVGCGFVISGIEQLMGLIPRITSLDVEGWFKLWVNSPDNAYLEMLNGLYAWMEGLHAQMETALILAFIILAVSMFVGLSDFLSGKGKRKGAIV